MQYKRPLRAIIEFMLKKERYIEVIIIRRTIDPEMDHKLYALGCILQGNENDLITETRRKNSMDGSDSDEEDQNSCSFVQKEIKNQSRSVIPVFII